VKEIIPLLTLVSITSLNTMMIRNVLSIHSLLILEFLEWNNSFKGDTRYRVGCPKGQKNVGKEKDVIRLNK
jgi:hypothetical protein